MIKVSRESFKMVVEDDPDPDTSYLEEEGYEERLSDYRAGRVHFVGVRARAAIVIPSAPGAGIAHTVESPGLWGIESDSTEYHGEVFKDECDVLADMLRAMGVSVSPDDDSADAVTPLGEAAALQREAVGELEVAALSQGRTDSPPLSRARRVLAALEAAARTPPPDPVLWEGTLDGRTLRVRRLDEHALLAEEGLTGGLYQEGVWRATDDETAMRAFEAALIARIP